MTKQTTFDLDEYARRTCEEICRHHAEAKLRVEVNRMQDGQENKMLNEMTFTHLHEQHCVNCPFEAMINLLREERDQNMKLTIEYDLEVV